MSSPAPSGGGAFRPLGKAPPVSRKERDEANNTRAMGLKVLYNIDDQNNANCLARWPDILNIHTAAIDERTVIGVVELKTCIQAVVQSSPELISRVGQDYTVYAYDYSEAEIPQSGQGMLSWALAADASPSLVTGRVCKNVLGLFSKGIQETLEVKLRLVPVTTALQNEYLSSMEKNMEKSRQSNPDNQEWNTLMNSQAGGVQMNRSFSAQTVSANQVEGFSREEFNNIVNPNPTIMVGGRASTPTNRGNKKVSQAKTSRPSSRSGVKRPRGRPPKNPVIASDNNISGSEDVGTDLDEGSSRKRVKPSGAEYAGNTTFGGAESLRIRASTAASIRGDTRPKSGNYGMNAGNGLQELPRAPTPVPGFPPQLSTRGPGLQQSSLRRESVQSPCDTGPYPRPYVSPYMDLDSGLGSERIHPSIESAVSSPEFHGSPAQTPQDEAQTPQDMASSPPELTSMQPPSSPVLPAMPRRSGPNYAGSGGLFGDEDEDDDLSLIPVEDGAGRQSVGPQGPNEGNVQPTNQSRVPTPRQQTPRPTGSRAASVTNQGEHSLPAHRNATMSRPSSSQSQKFGVPFTAADGSMLNSGGNQGNRVNEASTLVSLSIPPLLVAPTHVMDREKDKRGPPTRAASFSSLAIPSNNKKMSVPPPDFARSQTAGPPTTTLESENDKDDSTEHNARNQAKKTRIKNKLEQAIAEGTMPDFCFNCGTVETPTWRKAYYQDCQGDPGFIEFSDEPGRIICAVLTKDSAGLVTNYRLFKKSLAESEDFRDFTEVMLCNPCGIWVAKYKEQRPPEKWPVPPNPNEPPKKKQRVRGKRKSQEKKEQMGDNNLTSEAPYPYEAYPYSDYPSEANFPQSEAPFPQSEAPGTAFSPPYSYSRGNSAPGGDQAQFGQSLQTQSGLSLPKQQENTSLTSATAFIDENIAERGIREGSRHSPIELDADMGATRRLIFPSPRRAGLSKLLDGSENSSAVRATPTATGGQKDDVMLDNSDESYDKENHPPRGRSRGDSVSSLFGEESPVRPTTPVRQSNTSFDQSNLPSNPFKTPTRPAPNHRPLTRSQSKSASNKSKSSGGSIRSNRDPAKTPRRSPRHNPELLESPTTYMARIFSQPAGTPTEDLPDHVRAYLDNMDFTEDMGANFIDSFDDPNDPNYYPVATLDDIANIKYDILGGHGEPSDNEELNNILNGITPHPGFGDRADSFSAKSDDSNDEPCFNEPRFRKGGEETIEMNGGDEEEDIEIGDAIDRYYGIVNNSNGEAKNEEPKQ